MEKNIDQKKMEKPVGEKEEKARAVEGKVVPEMKKPAEEKEKAAGEKAGQEIKGPKEEKGKAPSDEIRYVVRIAGKDLDGKKALARSIMDIKGISHRYALIAAKMFEKETGIKYNTLLGKLPETMDKKLEEIIFNPEKHGVPEWLLNREKDFTSGESKHLLMSDLDFSLRSDIKRLNEIKSYIGLRHSWGLPVRGQRTKTGFRKRGAIVGVVKKEAKQAIAKKEEKKK